MLLFVALSAAAPPTNTPHGVVAGVRDGTAIVVLRGPVAPRPGDRVRQGQPGPTDPPFGITVSIAGNQVTVRQSDPARPLGADREAFFETAAPAPRLDRHLGNPEPVRFPLPAALGTEQDLIRAATSGDAATARIAMGRPINVDALGSRGGWPLAIAAQRRHIDIVRDLLDHHADPNLIDRKTGLTALKIAASWGRAGVARLLLGHGAAVDYAGPPGEPWNKAWTPLHHAASGDHMETVEVLLTVDARVDGVDGEGATPLMRAAENGAFRAARRLLAKGADVGHRSRSGVTPLMLAATADSLATLGLLIKKGAGIDARIPEGSVLPRRLWGATALMFAAERGRHADEVAFLILAGAEPDLRSRDGETAYDFTARAPDTWAREILAPSVNPIAAAWHTMKVRAGFDAYNGDPQDLRAILGLGIPANLITDTGRTLLGLATAAGNRAAMAVLQDMGANPNLANRAGDTPLHIAAAAGHLEAFVQLLADGGDPDLRNGSGLLPRQLVPPSRRPAFITALEKAAKGL